MNILQCKNFCKIFALLTGSAPQFVLQCVFFGHISVESVLKIFGIVEDEVVFFLTTKCTQR